MGLFEKIQSKIELFRLEQKYIKRRHRRSTFVCDAIYVDGEYYYADTGLESPTSSAAASPNATGSSNRSGMTSYSSKSSPTSSVNSNKRHSVAFAPTVGATEEEQREEEPQHPWERRSRWGRRKEDKRRSMLVVQEARWIDEE